MSGIRCNCFRKGVALDGAALDIGFNAEHEMVPLQVIAHLAAAEAALGRELRRTGPAVPVKGNKTG